MSGQIFIAVEISAMNQLAIWLEHHRGTNLSHFEVIEQK